MATISSLRKNRVEEGVLYEAFPFNRASSGVSGAASQKDGHVAGLAEADGVQSQDDDEPDG